MINIDLFIEGFNLWLMKENIQPWEISSNLNNILTEKINSLGPEYLINNLVAIHKTAIIEPGVILKAPIIIEKNCFIGSHSYLRNAVILRENVKIGAGCEIKSSIIFSNSSIAHFNFIGDSIIGSQVNFEAGSITANHYNERKNKSIYVLHLSKTINTHVEKFGSVVGDNSKIGANAVLSPGTLLNRNSIIKRLELVEQIKE